MKFLIGMGLLVFLVIACAQEIERTPQPVACTQEAKICPDGSAVSREGPNCEFAECPLSIPPEEKDLQLGESNSTVSSEKTFCTAKDKEMTLCAAIYDPVCGHLDDSSSKTFSNGCKACISENVEFYVKGEC